MNDDALRQLAKDVSRSGGVVVTQNGPREWFGSLTNPQFAGSVGFNIGRKTKPKKAEFVLHILRRQLEEMLFDAATAQGIGAPLVALGEPGFFGAQPSPSALTIDDVALRVRIPVLQGISTEKFIKLREAEYGHFQQFQVLLAEAIEETIREANVESPDTAADIVWRKKIRPQVVELERKIASSQRALTRKLLAGASAGAASAGIGSIVGALVGSAGGPIGTAVGAAVGTVGVAATALQFVTKHLEERQQFETAGTYFLWKAGKVTEHA